MRLTRTPLTLLNLLAQPVRTLWALAGVAVAALMLLMQLGFLGSVRATATLLYEQFDFDAIIVAQDYIDINRARSFSPSYLPRAQAIPGVLTAVPVRVNFAPWKDPTTETLGWPHTSADWHGREAEKRWNIFVLGVDPVDPVFRSSPDDAPDAKVIAPRARDLRRLLAPDTALIDRHSRLAEYGPQTPGAVRVAGETHITLVGDFNIGTGFGSNALMIVNPDTMKRVMTPYPVEPVNLGLVRVAPGADPAAVVAQLKARLPEDVTAYTRADLYTKEEKTWVEATSIGAIFSVGVGVALAVGVVFVIQVMASDIDARMGEYATLKAMGYTQGYLRKQVLTQAFLLAVFGFALGFAVASIAYKLAKESLALPMEMTWQKASAVFGLIVFMCMAAGLGVLSRLDKADPADLF